MIDMASVKATYIAPDGDDATTTVFGIRFFDGVPVEIEVSDVTAHAVAKLSNNRHFIVDGDASEAVPARAKPGRKPKAAVVADEDEVGE